MDRSIRTPNDRVTIAQVAAEAGVSPMTVSNVVNGRAGASKETRLRVQAAVKRLGSVSYTHLTLPTICSV